MRCRLRLSFLLSLMVLVSAAWAQQTLPSADFGDTAEAVETRAGRIEAIAREIRAEPGNVRLLELKDEARDLRRQADLDTVELRERRQELENLLRALGDPPAEGEEAEDPAVAERRRALNRDLGRINALLSQIEFNIAAATRIGAQIDEQRREAFAGELFTRGPVFFAASEWRDAAGTAFEGAAQARRAAEEWIRRKTEAGDRQRAVVSIIGALLLAAALLVPVRSAVRAAIRKRVATLTPYASRRVLVAAVTTLAATLPGIVGGLFLYEALRLNGAIPDEGTVLARTVWFGFVILLFADGAVNAVFSPSMPSWRIAPLATRNVLILRTLVLLAAFVLVADPVLRRGAELFGSSAALVFVQNGIVALVLSALLFLLSSGKLWRRGGENDDAAVPGPAPAGRQAQGPGGPAQPAAARGRFPSRVRLAGRITAVTAVLAVAAGFVAFGHYLTTRAFWLLGLFAVIWSLRALMREGVRLIDRRFSSEAKEAAEGEERLLYSWIGIAIDLLALIAFIPPALLILGADWSDVRGWITDAFLGFSIGDVRISFAKILSAIAIFLVLLWVTRMIQRTADSQLFPRSRIDRGVQNSLRTLIGYVGLIIAFAMAIGTAGFDLSNLAIIAGALSVGIGFGLQSIVNNFVSGLILLFERPIKVGDWIVTTSGEGIVKRISVRSTEIETFDRSSVIVPNSELISSAVTNLTHKDKLARVVIGVGASYDSDAKRVVDVLEDVARASPDVLDYPAPFVVFEDFGASSLDFTLRGYIRDVGETLKVRTRLRIAIHERFKKEGIEIPFPQRDLNIRGLAEEMLAENRGRIARSEAAE